MIAFVVICIIISIKKESAAYSTECKRLRDSNLTINYYIQYLVPFLFDVEHKFGCQAGEKMYT
jgi:hypothetical protein